MLNLADRSYVVIYAEMLSPRSHYGLKAKILALASFLEPWHLASVVALWPC